jgi:hypothetical protein
LIERPGFRGAFSFVLPQSTFGGSLDEPVPAEAGFWGWMGVTPSMTRTLGAAEVLPVVAGGAEVVDGCGAAACFGSGAGLTSGLAGSAGAGAAGVTAAVSFGTAGAGAAAVVVGLVPVAGLDASTTGAAGGAGFDASTAGAGAGFAASITGAGAAGVGFGRLSERDRVAGAGTAASRGGCPMRAVGRLGAGSLRMAGAGLSRLAGGAYGSMISRSMSCPDRGEDA